MPWVWSDQYDNKLQVVGSTFDFDEGIYDQMLWQLGHFRTFDTVSLDKWSTELVAGTPGWRNDRVATWRAVTLQHYHEVFFFTRPSDNRAKFEWLDFWIDFRVVRSDRASFVELFLYDVEEADLPRDWLRWACSTIQGTRRQSDGGPADNQIASYLIDADVLVTADKDLAAVVDRIGRERRVQMAHALRVRRDDYADTVIALLNADGSMQLMRARSELDHTSRLQELLHEELGALEVLERARLGEVGDRVEQSGRLCGRILTP